MSDKSPTIDSIRLAARLAVYWTVFHGLAMGIENRPKDKEELQNRACFMLEFAVKAGLLPPDEGNEWLDAVWGKTPLAAPFMKYCGEES